MVRPLFFGSLVMRGAPARMHPTCGSSPHRQAYDAPFGSKSRDPENALVSSGLLGREDLTAALACGQPAPYASVTEGHDGQVAATFRAPVENAHMGEYIKQ